MSVPSTIQEHVLPQNTRPAGYAALTHALRLQAPLRRASVVSMGSVRGNRREEGLVTVHDKRDWPGDGLVDHLEFAIKREPVDLTLLKKAFQAMDAGEIEARIKEQPLSATSRRMWFLYEWLTGRTLDLPDLKAGNYVPVLDPEAYVVSEDGPLSQRHRLRDNMPGTPAFCAIARRTEVLSDIRTRALFARATATVKETDPDTLRRAAAFLILADSRSSFEIEKERPAEDRVQRWGRSLARAGREQLSVDALNRLQAEVLGEATHARHGLRSEGVFLGAHDRYGTPMPEFIGARPEDVRELVDGLLAYNQILSRDKAYDPVVHAAGLAFGFVFVHPYEDGNGRLHRYLVHDVLTARGFSPPGIVFPVSKAILDRIEDYVRVLRDHSAPLLDYIPWKSTPTGNVEVYGDTVDLYRYPDVTRQAEFLFECIAHTVDHTFPEEVSYIESWDRAMAAAAQVVEMPNNRLQQFIGHVVRNNGVLPKTRRKRDFSDLPPDVVEELETAIREAFMLPEPPAEGPAAPTL